MNIFNMFTALFMSVTLAACSGGGGGGGSDGGGDTGGGDPGGGGETPPAISKDFTISLDDINVTRTSNSNRINIEVSGVNGGEGLTYTEE